MFQQRQTFCLQVRKVANADETNNQLTNKIKDEYLIPLQYSVYDENEGVAYVRYDRSMSFIGSVLHVLVRLKVVDIIFNT